MHRAKSRHGADAFPETLSDDGWGLAAAHSATLSSPAAQQQQQQQQAQRSTAFLGPPQQQQQQPQVQRSTAILGPPQQPTSQHILNFSSAIPPASIYDQYSAPRKASLLLLVCVMSLLVPLSDTIYLPSLERVKQDLGCSQAMAALTVAVYMLGAGCMALVWGPLSDRFGRRACYFSCSAAYIAATLGCMFAANVQQLVAFRALQGGSVSGFMAGGAGVVADVFSPRQRGLASGIFSVPMLLGPILGPLIGGATAAACGWRSCFIVLVSFAAAAVLMVVLLLPHETHQYYTVERVSRMLGIPAVRTFIEAPQILAHKPRFRPPWRPLGLLVEWSILPYSLVKFILFGCMFASLITLPQQLAQRRYALAEHLAGLAYVPVALGCFVAAPVGGKAADVAATRLQPCKQGRMVPGLAAGGVFMPAGLVAFGWTLSTHQHLAGVLTAHTFVGAAVGCYMPALFSYLSVEKQSQASAAAAAVQAVNLVVAAIFIQTSALAVERLGAGLFYSTLAALSLVAVLCTGVYTVRALRRTRRPPGCGTAALAAEQQAFNGGFDPAAARAAAGSPKQVTASALELSSGPPQRLQQAAGF